MPHIERFDHTLNTIGVGSVCWEGKILPDIAGTSGHGYGDEYVFHNPFRSTRHPMAE